MALVGLIFEVQKAETKPGEILRVTGASRRLGGWERREETAALELRTAPGLYPSWKLLSPVWIPEDELQDGLLIEYKYVKDPGPWAEVGQPILWEDAIPNRRVWLPKEEPGIWVVTDAAWNWEGPPSLRRLSHSELQARQEEVASSPRAHPTPRALRSPSKLIGRFDIEVVYAALGLEEESLGGGSTSSARRPGTARGQPGSARLSARFPVSAGQPGSARQTHRPASARRTLSARQPTSARQPGSARPAPGTSTVSEARPSQGDHLLQSSAEDGSRSSPEIFCLYKMSEAQDSDRHETDTDTNGGDTDSDDYEAESPHRMLTMSERSAEELCACGSSARLAERTLRADGAPVDPAGEGAACSMDEVMAQNARLRREIAELRRQNDELRRESAESREERAALRRRHEELAILCRGPQADHEVEPEQTYLRRTLDFDSAVASLEKAVGPLRNSRREADPCSSRQQAVVPRLAL